MTRIIYKTSMIFYFVFNKDFIKNITNDFALFGGKLYDLVLLILLKTFFSK